MTARCTYPDCGRPLSRRSTEWCSGHAAQVRRRGAPYQPLGRQGFASMDPARHAAIARLGGRAAHEWGVAHEWTPEEAKVAGRMGGLAKRGWAARKAG